MSDWTFFSNYGHVLVCLAKAPEARLRDVAQEVGITERAVQKILRDLQDGGFLRVSKQGRRNRYAINRRKSLRHALESRCTVGRLLKLMGGPAGRSDAVPAEPAPQEENKPQAGPPARKASASPGQPAGDQPKKDDKGDRPGPVDIRQQGTLF